MIDRPRFEETLKEARALRDAAEHLDEAADLALGTDLGAAAHAALLSRVEELREQAREKMTLAAREVAQVRMQDFLRELRTELAVNYAGVLLGSAILPNAFDDLVVEIEEEAAEGD